MAQMAVFLKTRRTVSLAPVSLRPWTSSPSKRWPGKKPGCAVTSVNRARATHAMFRPFGGLRLEPGLPGKGLAAATWPNKEENKHVKRPRT